MTPMTKLKNNLEIFKNLAGTTFNEINLNKSGSHEYYDSWCGKVTHHTSDGVMNDFLKLFTINVEKDNSYGFAFIFDYIDLQEKDYKAQYSIKIKEKDYPKEYFISTEKMDIDEFKDKLNQVNKKLKALTDLNYKTILDSVHSIFIPDFEEQVTLQKYTRNKSKFKKI